LSDRDAPQRKAPSLLKYVITQQVQHHVPVPDEGMLKIANHAFFHSRCSRVLDFSTNQVGPHWAKATCLSTLIRCHENRQTLLENMETTQDSVINNVVLNAPAAPQNGLKEDRQSSKSSNMAALVTEIRETNRLLKKLIAEEFPEVISS